MQFDTAAVPALAQQMGVPVTTVTEQLVGALTDAYARTYGAVPGAVATLDVTAGQLCVVDPDGHDITPADFGRTAATAARQALQMWMRDVERIRKVGVWAGREQTLVTGTIRAHAARNARGEVLLDVGTGVEAVMPSGEQIPGESYAHGQTLTVIIVAVNATDRGGVRITISRRQPTLVAALLAQVSPELADGRVQIVGIARDPGSRVKVAVRSTVPGLNARGALIGEGAARISRVAAELRGEKIDVITAVEDQAAYVAAALTPATVTSARVVDPVRHQVEVTVPAAQLGLAAGKDGTNTRLAQRLTGTRIEIKAAA